MRNALFILIYVEEKGDDKIKQKGDDKIKQGWALSHKGYMAQRHN